jgi:DNA-binding beta-propeller fold protein YncE
MENKFFLKKIIQLSSIYLVAFSAIAQGLNGGKEPRAVGVARTNYVPYPVALVPSVTRGDAPLTVKFSLNTSNVSGSVQSVTWDWKGDGTSNFTTSTLSSQNHVYDAGTYLPVVTIKTSEGAFSNGAGMNSDFADILARPVAIRVDIPPQIVWSQDVAGPVAVKANADGSVYVLKDQPPAFLLYKSNGTVAASFDLQSIHFSPLTANGFDVDKNGNVYLAMTSLNQILKLKPAKRGAYVPDGEFNTNAAAGVPGAVLSSPWDVAVSPDGSAIYVSDGGNNRIVKLNATNGVVRFIKGFSNPKGVTYDETGRPLVADYGNKSFFSLLDDNPFDGFREAGIKASADPMVLYTTDGKSVKQYDSFSFTFFREIPNSFKLNNPRGVSIWPVKTEQRVYIADYGNNRVIGVTFPRPDPMVVWNAMKQALAKNNLAEALTYFSRFSVDKYKAEFQAAGVKNVSIILNRLPPPVLVDMTDSFAHYTVTSADDQSAIMFYINFANEYGSWKISSY